MSTDNVYLLCKQIILESGLLNCEFDDENTLITCNQFDNPFEIKFSEKHVPLFSKSEWRFLILTESACYMKPENLGLLVMQMKYLLGLIYKNIFNNSYSFNSIIYKGMRGDCSGYAFKVEYYFFENGKRTDNDYALCEWQGDSCRSRYIKRQYMDLDRDDDLTFDEETDILALLTE